MPLVIMCSICGYNAIITQYESWPIRFHQISAHTLDKIEERSDREVSEPLSASPFIGLRYYEQLGIVSLSVVTPPF